MDDQQTTTDASAEAGGKTIQGIPVDDQGQALPQPENAEEQPAAVQEDVKTDQTPQDDKPSDDKPTENPQGFDDDTLKWMESKGIDPASPDALTKMARSAREAEKAMHQKAQKASELERTTSAIADEGSTQIAEATGESEELVREVRRLNAKMQAREFWEAHPEAKEYESQIVSEIQANPVLASDLEAAYAKVMLKNADSLKSEGKKEALKTLASKQQATVPIGSAVHGASQGPTKITPENVDSLVAQNDLEWFKKNQDAINRAMAG